MTNIPPSNNNNFFNPSNINENPINQMNYPPIFNENKEIRPEPQNETEVVVLQNQNDLFNKAKNAENQNTQITPNSETPSQNSEKKEEDKPKPTIKKSSIFGSTFMITNICLGTTIFTFAVRAKSFGLVWMLFFCFVVAAVNYWSITRCIYASSRCQFNDYSEITEHFLGRKMRILLNIIIILYSYASLMCFIALIFPLFGRFIQSGFYRNKYIDYDNFYDEKWGKAYIKYPFFFVLALLLSFICLIKDINKLNFSAYIGVAACGYALIVVMVECHSYYQHYKDTVYKEDDDNTHVNWINLGDAFTKDLIFFKGIANLIFAYACQSGIFPIYAGFKVYETTEVGLKKMKMGTLLGTLFTTALHIISIVCGFLTDPITPEDLIIYRKNKGTGRDIAMVIARLLVSISLIFTVPGYYFPLRLGVINSFTQGKLTNKFNILLTFISIFACAVISAVYDKILNYLNYIGFISVFISFLFPALMYVYSSGKKITYWRNLLDIILAVVMCLIGLVAFVATLIDDIKG
jgi:amino acid permease